MTAYFDANATTPLSPAAREAWLNATDTAWHNPSSPYRAAARARNELERNRARLAALLGTVTDRVVFTSGATEGLNAVLAAMVKAAAERPLLVGATEHPAVKEAAEALLPEAVERLPVQPNGVLDRDALAARLANQNAPGPAGVAVMAANNETGVCHPLRDVVELTTQAGVPLAIDAVQWWGKQPGADLPPAAYVVGSAHKFGGPKGVGFVLLGPEQTGFQGQRGGAQENDHRGGTENLPGIAAMVAALEEVIGHASPVHLAAHAAARDAFAQRMVTALGAQWVGQGAPLLPQTAMLVMPSHDQMRWVAQLDKRGFAVSTGAACATGKDGPSHVLTAMGFRAEEARRALRFSALPSDAPTNWSALGDALLAVHAAFAAEESPTMVITL